MSKAPATAQPELESGTSSRASTPPPYSESDRYSTITLESSPDVHDGRINLALDSKFVEILSSCVPVESEDHEPESDAADFSSSLPSWALPLNIVIQVVGSRGDVQPFVALGTELKRFGHRVRIATHGVFEDFVHKAGLEFFSIGGDPTQLMAYMVKNPGLIPGMKTLREGEIRRKRAMIAEMLDGCWKSCIEPDAKTHVPFVAQAIIANPVSFAHIHCAQLLSIPLHLMFTMPWTSTRAFPHPLANIKNSKYEPRLANYLSYGVVEMMTWQGIGGVINKWRKSLDLEPVPTTEAPFLASTFKIPHTYCWSGALVPKPKDWAKHIDVCGFFFRDMPDYSPPPDLADFLASGSTPIYIGFGSIVIDDPAGLTKTLLEAVRACGVRAIISRGWSKIGEASSNETIFYLDDCPHEWLFQNVRAVIHHGGAGTTACGLLNARPTLVIPFFGDQPFWGQMIASTGAGPNPIPYKALNSDNLTAAIAFCLESSTATAAEEVASKMRQEQGVQQAVASFHRQLPRDLMSCELVPQQPATWMYFGCKPPMRLSTLAIDKLSSEHVFKFKWKHVKHYGPTPIYIKNKRWEPITGGVSAGTRMGYDISASTVGIFTDPVKVYLEKDQPGAEKKSQPKLAGEAALASAKSIGNLTTKSFKGGMVDIPLALAEGFRNTPRLWGETVKEQKEITGAGSGFAVAGKSLAHGFYDGVGGFFYKPYKGARDEGALGFAKGCGKGISGIALQPVAGALGVFGYAGDGISKSIDHAMHNKAVKRIMEAKRAEAEYLRKSSSFMTDSSIDIVKAFGARQASMQEKK